MCALAVDYLWSLYVRMHKILKLREKMKKTEILETLKENYNRDLRKQVVKTLLNNEKETGEPNYQLINQIFSYVLKELGWSIAENTKEWDNTPLDIMQETFPHIESTKWYDEQILTAKKMIDVLRKDQIE
jgi:hypothetical protein